MADHSDEAKRICDTCAARTQCLAWALANEVTDGVWGGTTEHERRQMRRMPAKVTTARE